MMSSSPRTLFEAAHHHVRGAQLPELPTFPRHVELTEDAPAFAEKMVSQIREAAHGLMLVDGPPGGGKTTAIEALKAKNPQTLTYEMDWRLFKPGKVEERRANLFENFDLYCDDGLVVNELSKVLFGPAGDLMISDVYDRHGTNSDHPFKNVVLPLPEDSRHVIFEGAGVTMLSKRFQKGLTSKQLESLQVAPGLVMVGLREAILAALWRDVHIGKITSVEGARARAAFRIQDASMAFERRGILTLMQDPPSDLVVLDNRPRLSEFVQKQLERAA